MERGRRSTKVINTVSHCSTNITCIPLLLLLFPVHYPFPQHCFAHVVHGITEAGGRKGGRGKGGKKGKTGKAKGKKGSGGGGAAAAEGGDEPHITTVEHLVQLLGMMEVNGIVALSGASGGGGRLTMVRGVHPYNTCTVVFDSQQSVLET